MVHALLYTSVALLLLTWAGNQICRGIFKLTGLKNSIANLPTPTHSAGRWIGAFERLIIALGLIVHSWEILAVVIALKTVARFKEMDERDFAEYFLVGSLFSILWTMLVTSAWLAYDHKLGIDIRNLMEQWLGI
ncbi:hypothetical protein [Hoeflea ulvae]|uniref:Uncharacterized protein n=1 Tax=Hoeflea ulvae TaxID=2983764 RepID=A0ABT3YIC4_9HYPH|nr:hypothetical protein [Hoeflea ulvae]MCY0095644.1 hypothetical protein [Hoeflea ulvae]